MLPFIVVPSGDGITGIDLLDVTFLLDKATCIRVTEEDWHRLFAEHQDTTVGQLYDLILDRMHRRNVFRFDLGLNESLWLWLEQVIAEVQGLRPADVQLCHVI